MKRCEVDRNKLSPMMAQYMQIKDKYADVLLFYRLGDFYELFFEDALIASKELELTLTGRVAGLEERVPMCGVPYHAVKSYIEKVINKGYKVAICEQLEDPKTTKGMVKRGVTDVISKGTIADLELLKSYENSFVASLLIYPDTYILTALDISTGRLISSKVSKNINKIITEIFKYNIKEIIFNGNEEVLLINTLKNDYNIEIDYYNELADILPENIDNKLNDIRCKMGVRHLFGYLTLSLKDLSTINDIEIISNEDYLYMDAYSANNLELTETVRNKDREFSLLWLLDKCKTAMGSRKLRNMLLSPLKDISQLNKRYDMIEKLNDEFILKDNLITLLDEIYDIERLTGKLTNGSFNARDMLQLKRSLKPLPEIIEIVKKLNFDLEIKPFKDIYDLLEKSIYEDPPITLKEGYLIKEGYNIDLDSLREIKKNGKDFIAKFENEIKEKTGFKNLKVGFNKVFGYYIEISKAQAKDAEKFGFERKQTLANGERFISPELKEKEDMILNAEEKIIDLEYSLFMDIKNEVKTYVEDMRKTADNLSFLDVMVAFSIDSEKYNLVRPLLNENHDLEIIEGRHPVVENTLKGSFVANDCKMNENICAYLITGPNMSGKSTYMRQIAITIIMAQIGCFVPCKYAKLPIIDKIFTRIGASDDLAGGKSTFMVEMSEANNAISNATENSLIIFDELGRGTATYDGMAIAQSIIEYICDNIKCKTLFSTHYHELTILDKKYKSIKNVHVDAKEENGNLYFLHKVKPGAIDKSYGVHVASLAGLPESLIKRADEILNSLENSNKKEPVKEQLSFDFEEKKEKPKDILEGIDILNTTPIEALNILYKLKENK